MASQAVYKRIPGAFYRLNFSSRQTNGLARRCLLKNSSFSGNAIQKPHLNSSALSKSHIFLPTVRQFTADGGQPSVELRDGLTIDAHDLIKAVENDEVYIVDVRKPEECTDGHIKAKRWVNIPVQEFGEAIKLGDDAFEKKYGATKPQKEAEDIVFHCRSGVRSTAALYMAMDHGYHKARHYPEGWIGWEAHTYPIKNN